MAISTYHQELERRSQDLIKVFNPTEKDYVIEWDRKNGTKMFRVPAKSEAVLLRYIAEKYIKEMFDQIINKKIEKTIISENQKRVSKGMVEMDKTQKTGEQMKFESALQPSSEEAKEIISLLYRGIQQEYGIDSILNSQTTQQKGEEKTVFESALTDIEQGNENVSQVSEIGKKIDNEISEKTPLESLTKQFRCDYIGCNFETDTRIALAGHQRSHKVTERKEQALKGISKNE